MNVSILFSRDFDAIILKNKILSSAYLRIFMSKYPKFVIVAVALIYIEQNNLRSCHIKIAFCPAVLQKSFRF